MPPTLYLIRHAEAEHNIKRRFDIQDPILTPAGRTECRNLRKAFPHHREVDLILSSPHRRAIETTILTFGNTLTRPGLDYFLVPDAQEVSAKPCDVGFSVDILKDVEIPKLFKDAGLNFGVEKIRFEFMREGWNMKKAMYAPTIKAVQTRAAALRAWLYRIPAKHVVLVTHGAFLHFLTEDGTVKDPKKGTGFINCEVRTFEFTRGSTLEEAHILEVERERRYGMETDSTILAGLDSVR